MATTIDKFEKVAQMLEADRAIVLVAVPWSVAPKRSRQVLDVLEATQKQWVPDVPIAFYVLQPESEERLNAWYEQLCSHNPAMELHGHGWGPFWWLARGRILHCLSKPFEEDIGRLQDVSLKTFSK